jgi:hypothetical protein
MNVERVVRLSWGDKWLVLTETEAVAMRDALDKAFPRLVEVPEQVWTERVEGLVTSDDDHLIVK